MSQYPKVDVTRLLSEEPISLTVLARKENVSPPTPWRWGTKGVLGIQLETFLKGGRRYTTQEAFRRFVEATTAASIGQSPKVRTNRQLQAKVARINAALDRAGI